MSDQEKSQQHKKGSTLSRLKIFMGNREYLFPVAIVFSGISSLLNLVPFLFVWLIANEVLSNPNAFDMDKIVFYAWLAFASTVAEIVVYFLALSASHFAAFRAEVGMRKYALEKIIKMPLGYFDKHSSGKIRKIVDDGSSATHSFLAHQMPDLAGSIVAPIALLAVILIIDWRLGLASLIPVILSFVIMASTMNKRGEEFRKEYMDKLEDMSSEAVEYVRGIPVVKTFGQSVFSFKRFTDAIFSYRDMVAQYSNSMSTKMSLFQTVIKSAVFFLIPLAIFLMTRENLALVLSDFIFYALIAPTFSSLIMRSMYFQNYSEIAAQTIDRFDEVLNYPQMDFVETSQTMQDNSIEFKNVVFAYEGENKNAVDGISFTIKEGETLALVGASGGGKTTIARLAARFWDAKSGEILIGGVDIKQISKVDLMQKISFVFQNTKLFKGSIKDNITYGKQDATAEQIEKAMALAKCKDIVENLSDGLETVMGSQGTYLSGGEQQRIALARAILKDAPIVLLDEATAFADPENEHLIQKALTELSKGKTRLMIAHRLTSIVDADKILVLENGKIKEFGKHNELLEKQGLYAKMWSEYQKSIAWKIKE